MGKIGEILSSIIGSILPFKKGGKIKPGVKKVKGFTIAIKKKSPQKKKPKTRSARK